MTDARRRAWRTLGQVALAAWLATLADHAVVPSDSQAVLLIPFIAWAIAYVQNYLEDRGTIPAILKAPASPGRRPVPRDAVEFESAVMDDGCDQ